jgi:hypothetical protein
VICRVRRLAARHGQRSARGGRDTPQSRTAFCDARAKKIPASLLAKGEGQFQKNSKPEKSRPPARFESGDISSEKKFWFTCFDLNKKFAVIGSKDSDSHVLAM